METSRSNKAQPEANRSEVPLSEEDIIAIGFALLTKRQESLGRYGRVRILESKEEGDEK